MTNDNPLAKTPAHFLANFDLAALGLLKTIPELVARPSPASIEELENALSYLRSVRDAYAVQHGLEAQTSDDSMALIRQGLVDQMGEEVVANAEVTGQVPASVVADAMLDECYGSDNA